MKHTRRLALAGRPEALVLSMTVTGVVVGVLSHLHTQRSFKLLCSIDPGLANPLPLHVNTAASVEPFLRSRDAAAGPLRPGCHSEVTWHGAEEEPTRISVLHLHGWSASPLEIDPVDARLATNLRANLLRFRLSGHGLASADGYELYANATRATLLRDVAQAFACGRLLGRRVLLIASSTGATLCLWLCAQPLWANDVVGLVALSPALALRARSYHALKYLVALLPAAASEWLFRAIVGREFRINVKAHALVDATEKRRAWTLVYPAAALRHIVELYLSFELSITARDVLAPVLVLANEADPDVDFYSTRAFFGAENTTQLSPLPGEHPHCITGRINAPSTVDAVVALATKFATRAIGDASGPERRSRTASYAARLRPW